MDRYLAWAAPLWRAPERPKAPQAARGACAAFGPRSKASRALLRCRAEASFRLSRPPISPSPVSSQRSGLRPEFISAGDDARPRMGFAARHQSDTHRRTKSPRRKQLDAWRRCVGNPCGSGPRRPSDSHCPCARSRRPKCLAQNFGRRGMRRHGTFASPRPSARRLRRRWPRSSPEAPPYPPLDDREAWRARVATSNQAVLPTAIARASTIAADVEEISRF